MQGHLSSLVFLLYFCITWVGTTKPLCLTYCFDCGYDEYEKSLKPLKPFFPFINRMSKHNRVEVLEKAEKDLGAVMDQYMSRLVKELQGTDFWKLRRAYSPGVSILGFSFCICSKTKKKEFCCLPLISPI